MKLLFIIFHFEYSDAIEELLDKHNVRDYVRHPMLESKDLDGKHFGTQVYPGNSSMVQAMVDEDELQPIMDELQAFQQAKASQHHVQAFVVPIEQRLG